ncbi:MAG: M14 family zinc carboxypeptidase [Saprospiraceae bacterium]
MKRVFILIVWIPFLVAITHAQQIEQYEISIPRGTIDLMDIQASGIAIDHGLLITTDSFHIIGFRQDIDRLQTAGIVAEARLLQPKSKQAAARRNSFCTFDDIFDSAPPANFSLGSLQNGYYTLEEIYDQMDEMRRIYPGLISNQLPIDTYETYEGRSMYHYVLSSNVLPSQVKPKVMMTALTHAREPMSIISQVYFYWWLLEQYDSNEQVTWLLDNTELYLVPCVNPDGYAYNTTETPGRMGFWRKNRRPNLDGTFGVDINRNYVIDWGGIGASNDTGSEIYHGVAPLSEPEAAAVNFLHMTIPFETVLNVHSYSNLVITPGYERLQQAGPRDLNLSLAQAMRRDNGYVVGEGLNTVLYASSGSATDHFAFHNGAATGNSFSFTPEIGSRTFGFFPPEDTLAGMAANALLTNFRALQSAHFSVVLDPFYSGLQDEGTLRLLARRISKTSGVATLKVTSLDPRLRFGSTSVTLDFTNTDVISIKLPYTVEAGNTDLLAGYELSFSDMPHTLPFESGPIVYKKATVLMEEAGAELANVFSVNPASDNGNQPVLGFNDQTAAGVVFAPVNYPEDAESLLIRYKVDYLAPALSEASSPIFNASDLADPVCFHQGSYVLGNNFSNYWGETNGYLDDFYVIDEVLQPGGSIGFDLAANVNGVYTYIDSLEVIALSPAIGGQTSTQDPSQAFVQFNPNPAQGSVRIETDGPSITQVVIYDAVGRSLGVRPVKAGELSLAGIPTGVYMVQFFDERGHQFGHSKLVVC